MARCIAAYRKARREGSGRDGAMDAVEASLRKLWPELSAKDSNEAVAAIAYASSHHAAWLWDGVRG
jgi:hypothetical protein